MRLRVRCKRSIEIELSLQQLRALFVCEFAITSLSAKW